VKKAVYLESVEYAMLQNPAKKSRNKPEKYLAELIRQEYEIKNRK